MSTSMRIVIATDIFGHGECIEELSNSLKNVCSSISIISPYAKSPVTLTDEHEAYCKFSSECGHERFSKLTTQIISASSARTFLVGFSAGAAAIWHSIGSNVFPNLIHFVGFYPTQIRNNLDLTPSCSTKIIFPCREDSFDVSEISKILTKKAAVECQLTDSRHGFMNPQSKNYDSAQAKTFSEAIKVTFLEHAAGFLNLDKN